MYWFKCIHLKSYLSYLAFSECSCVGMIDSHNESEGDGCVVSTYCWFLNAPNCWIDFVRLQGSQGSWGIPGTWYFFFDTFRGLTLFAKEKPILNLLLWNALSYLGCINLRFVVKAKEPWFSVMWVTQVAPSATGVSRCVAFGRRGGECKETWIQQCAAKACDWHCVTHRDLFSRTGATCES